MWTLLAASLDILCWDILFVSGDWVIICPDPEAIASSSKSSEDTDEVRELYCSLPLYLHGNVGTYGLDSALEGVFWCTGGGGGEFLGVCCWKPGNSAA